jgi:high affinity Mn2+ porin
MAIAGALALAALQASAAEPERAGASDWRSFYVGGYFEHFWGGGEGTAESGAAAAPVSFDFFQSYDPFKGTGSYALGLRAGFNHSLAPGIVVGAEADLSAPSSIAATRLVVQPDGSSAVVGARVDLAASVRGRIGVLRAGALFFATAGLALAQGQFTRTGTATSETASALRVGWTAGAGVEVPLAPHWTATLEYLFTSFGPTSLSFAASGDRLRSDLDLQSVRVGLNYAFGGAERGDRGPEPLKSDWFNVHGQTTFVEQYAVPFRAPYRGPNSLAPNTGREVWDATFFLGWRPWQGAEIWVNPEIDQGFGLSSTTGVAGFPNGEAYKVGFEYPYARIPRMFIRQTIPLGGANETIEAGPNQFAQTTTADRIIITAGKFATVDIFDNNRYAHDPRNDFLNWALIDTGTFDYAADAWAFTYGIAVEWVKGNWTLRGGFFDLPIVPNSTDLDPGFAQVQWMGEIERRYKLFGEPGKVLLTGYLTRGRMGKFEDAIALAERTGEPADIAAVRDYRGRVGFSASLEQQITKDLGVFARFGVADGAVEPFAFTDIDRTFAAGIVTSGRAWGRPDDTWGVAGITNAIIGVHQAFFNAGGLGVLIGDGQLPHPRNEQILETYYSFPLLSWRATLDYQLVVNPAYNADRGPVSVIATRLHAQF